MTFRRDWTHVWCILLDSKLRKLSSQYPEDGPQKDLHSVTRTNCPVSLPGLLWTLWGTSHELGPPKLKARVVDIVQVCNSSSAHSWWYECLQRIMFLHCLSIEPKLFQDPPQLKSITASESFLPSPSLPVLVSQGFWLQISTSHWGIVGPFCSPMVPNVGVLGCSLVTSNVGNAVSSAARFPLWGRGAGSWLWVAVWK